MKDNKEIEFKNLLTKEEYEKIIEYFLDEKFTKEFSINQNYYFDYKNILKNNNAALRIRIKKDFGEMTLKIKKEKHNIEVNSTLNMPAPVGVVPHNELKFKFLPENIKKELVNQNIIFKKVRLFQKTVTNRCEVRLDSGLLVIDKNIIPNDYELEFEVLDYEKGKKDFLHLLEKFNIKQKKAKPKIERAVEQRKNKGE